MKQLPRLAICQRQSSDRVNINSNGSCSGMSANIKIDPVKATIQQLAVILIDLPV